MSFVILALIIFLLYACLTTYGSLLKVIAISAVIYAMTAGFLFYGIRELGRGDVFSVVGTEINLTYFIHVCVVWFAADVVCTVKIIKNYRYYLEVNISPVRSAGQEEG